MTRPKILIADDEPDIVTTIRYRFQKEGWDTETASDGLGALNAFTVGRPDVIVLDVMMPNLNGYRLCRQIKENCQTGETSQTKIVLLTARRLDDQEREEIFMNFSHADKMMYKPVDLDELVSAVSELLADRQTPDASPALV